MFNAYLVSVFLACILSIFRSFFVPFFGERASLVSALPIVIIAFLSFFRNHKNASISAFLIYALLFTLPLLFTLNTLWLVPAAFAETAVPYILFLSPLIPISQYHSLTFLRRLVLFIYFGLLLGLILQILGVSLPVIHDVPSYGFEQFSSFRFTSFVGTSGPFTLSFAYLAIALSFLFPKYFYPILLITSFFQLFTLSRSGLAVILGFLVLCQLFKLFLSGSISLKLHRNIFCFVSFFIILLFCLIFSYPDLILGITSRFFAAFDFVNDAGSSERLARMSTLFSQHLFNGPLPTLVGMGTGSTSRVIGGEQGESQLVKIFVEWGIVGVLVFFSVLYKSILTRNFSPMSLALFTVVLGNLIFLQAFTSPPIYVGMAIAVWASQLSFAF